MKKNNILKNGLLAIGCLSTIIAGMNSVNALTPNSDGTYTNNRGINISVDQYNRLKSDEWEDKDIDKMSQDMVIGIVAGNYNFGSETKNFAITTTFDENGNPIDIKQLELSDVEVAKALKSDNYHILSDGKLHDISKEIMPMASHQWNHQTTYKKLHINYFQDGWNNDQKYRIELTNTWLKTPQVKGYDVIAVRFDNNKDTSSYNVVGIQDANNGNYQYYANNSSNMKKFTNGTGLTQNLFDGSTSFKNQLIINSATTFGAQVHGTYQHSQSSSLTMAQSKSYTISSNGLGEVLKFSGSIGNNYDGMEGVYSGITLIDTN